MVSSWQDSKDQSFCKEDQHDFITVEQRLSPEQHPFFSEEKS